MPPASYGNRLPLPPKVAPPPWMPVRINWRHPISRGLVLVSLPHRGDLSNAAQPGVATVFHGTRTLTTNILGAATDNGSGFSYKIPIPKMGDETGFSVFTHATNNQVSGAGQNPLDCDDGTNRVFQMILATSPVFITFTTGGSANLTFTSGSYSSANTVGGMTLSGRIDATEKIPYINFNGARTTGASQGSVKLVSAGAAITIGSLTSPYAQQFLGPINLSAVWSRKLLDAEEDLLHRDPYCFFELDAPFSLRSVSSAALLVGDISAVSALSGNLSANIFLAGGTSAAPTLTGDLSTDVRLAGGASTASTLGGDLATGVQLAGGVSTVSTLAGDISVDVRLAGGVSTVSTIAGDLSTAVLLAGGAVSTPTTAGDLSTDILLSGDLSSEVTLAGGVSTAILLAGEAASRSITSGDLSSAILLAGNISSTAALTGEVLLFTGIPRLAPNVVFPGSRREIVFDGSDRDAVFPSSKRTILF